MNVTQVNRRGLLHRRAPTPRDGHEASTHQPESAHTRSHPETQTTANIVLDDTLHTVPRNGLAHSRPLPRRLLLVQFPCCVVSFCLCSCSSSFNSGSHRPIHFAGNRDSTWRHHAARCAVSPTGRVTPRPVGHQRSIAYRGSPPSVATDWNSDTGDLSAAAFTARCSSTSKSNRRSTSAFTSSQNASTCIPHRSAFS